MAKVFKLKDLPVKNGENVTYSDEYEVAFFFQKPDGFWEKQIETYRTDGKGRHDQVKAKWLQDYAGQNVTFINVTYQ